MTKKMKKRVRRQKWERRTRWLDNTMVVCLLLIMGTATAMAMVLWALWPWIEVIAMGK